MATDLRSRYLQLRHVATILRDEGGYDLGAGECNPVIFQEFVGELLDRNSPPYIWEPFAGHTGQSNTIGYCLSIGGIYMMSQDIHPSDSRVMTGDSTREGPPMRPYGMFFHPPYFGSSVFSEETGEMSLIDDLAKYMRLLTKTITLANLHEGGLVCAVCRSYRHQGKIIDLPMMFLEIFSECDYDLVEIWSSEPDLVLIMRKL